MSSERETSRILTVYYTYLNGKDRRPLIRLQGKWLPQLAAVSLLAGGADRRADGLWDGCTVLAGRLPVMPAAFFAVAWLLAIAKKKTTTARWW